MSNKTNKALVAIYARFSTDRQDARSIDDQVRRCRAFAEKQGLTVVAEYADAAQSGAHLERAEMQRLMADVQRAGGPAFSAVLVDDLSRLSRDIWDMGQLVFRHLAGFGITLIDVNTGMSSDNVAARTTFAALGIANDAFLQLVRTETHRGLEGRAIAGFATGDRVYGYRSEKESNPPDPEHPRSVYVIHDGQAEVVRRVFRLYAEGVGQRSIATLLNEERVPAPYDRSHGNKQGKGWGHSTVRAMLLNRRYVGDWSWNVRQWVRVPGKKSKRALRRSEEQVTRRQYPHLAIIDQTLWDQVQARFNERRDPRKGRPVGVGRAPHLLSGLLKCGLCGSSLRIVSSVQKNGRRYANFGCSARDSKGPTACANKTTVAEMTVNREVFAEVSRRLKDPALVDEFLRGYLEQAAARQRADRHAQPEDLLAQFEEQKRRVDRLAEAVANAGWSEALGSRLRDEETKLVELKRKLATQPTPPSKSPKVPTEKWLRERFAQLQQLAEQAPKRGREALQGWFGPVKVFPPHAGAGSHCVATGEIRLGPSNLAETGADSDILTMSHCGGRI